MIVDRGQSLNWYKGSTLLETLETVDTSEKTKNTQLRLPVQYVCRPRDSTNEDLHDFRAFMGRIESGLLKINDKIKVLPSGHESSVKEIRIGEKLISEATYEQSVTVSLNDEIDISRGDMLVQKEDILKGSKSFTANVCWLSESNLTLNRTYLIMHTTRLSKAKISSINYKININTLETEQAIELQTNDIANISFKLAQPLIIDLYSQNRSTGCFIIIDETTFHTVGAGMIESIE
jgi:sulfate adenylyltransferase subunit 1